MSGFLQGYPDGCLVEVKNILDNKLPTMARQIDLVCPVETIREVINYAEGYEGCIAFPERGVRSIIKEGLDTLQKRVLDMVNSVINLVVKEVQECVREECSQENLQFEVQLLSILLLLEGKTTPLLCLESFVVIRVEFPTLTMILESCL